MTLGEDPPGLFAEFSARVEVTEDKRGPNTSVFEVVGLRQLQEVMPAF